MAEAVPKREVIKGPQVGEVPVVLDHWVVHPFDVRHTRLPHGRGKRTPFRPAGGRRVSREIDAGEQGLRVQRHLDPHAVAGLHGLKKILDDVHDFFSGGVHLRFGCRRRSLA